MTLSKINANLIEMPLAVGFHQVPDVLVDSASVTPDFTSNNFFTWTITQDAILNFPGTVPGAGVWHIFLKQDGSGGHTIAFDTGYNLIDGALDESAQAENILTIISDGSGTDLDVFTYQQTTTATSPYDIPYSVRFNDIDATYLTRTPATAGNSKTWTWSGWVKRSDLSSFENVLFSSNSGADPSPRFSVFFLTNNSIELFNRISSVTYFLDTSATYRDVSAWYHVVVTYDSTNPVSTLRQRIWINGEELTELSSSTYPGVNADTSINSTNPHRIGDWATGWGNAGTFDGYMAEINFVDGLALGPENFGRLNNNDIWIPIEVNTASWPTNSILFDRTAGSNIGDMSGGGGLAAAFDGTTAQNAAASASLAASTTAYVGKDHGSGQSNIVTSYVVYPSTDQGFTTDANLSIRLYGSNSLPATATDGTLLHDSGSFADSLSAQTYNFVDIDTSTGFRYHWVTIVPASSATNYVAEVQFNLENSYGRNGYRLDFSDNATASALGTDRSGNGNDWTVSGLTTASRSTDSPTNSDTSGNNANWNSLSHTNGVVTFSNGNLNASGSTTTQGIFFSTLSIPTIGKVYAETELDTVGGSGFLMFGITEETYTAGSFGASGGWGGHAQSTTLTIYNETTSVATPTISNGDIMQIAYDADTGNIWIGLDDVWYDNAGGTTGNPSNGTNPTATISTTEKLYFLGGVYTGQTLKSNFGSNFTYNPPTGFSGLSTARIINPAIATPSEYFDVLTYTGNGINDTRIWQTSFKPDLVWIKNRDTNPSDHKLFDSRRGATMHLSTNDTNAQAAEGNSLKSFDYQGFTLGTGASSDVNTDGVDYIAWCWKKSPISGFDIQTYEGTGSAGLAISHDLGAIPEFLIVKNYETSITNWAVYHHLANGGTNPEQYFGLLNSTAAFTNTGGTAYWNDVAPTDTTFTLGNSSDTNASLNDFVAYLWSGIAGYSRFGAYIGNGSATGPFVNLGFKPKFLLTKSLSAVGGWQVFDSIRDRYNLTQTRLSPYTTNADTTGLGVDFLSNGFKIRNTNSDWNTASATYLYAAFAEDPFKLNRSR